MMQKGGKLSANYTRSDRFKNLKAALEEDQSDIHRGISPIVEIIHGDGGGTWVHPSIAIDAAMWISPKFGIAVTRLVQAFLSGQVTTQQSQDAARRMAAEVEMARVDRREERQVELELKRLGIEAEKMKIEAEKMNLQILEVSERYDDVLVSQALRSHATNFFAGRDNNSHSIVYLDIPEILKRLNIPLTLSSKYGKLVARKFRNEFNQEPRIAKKVVNGCQRDCKVYEEDNFEIISEWILNEYNN